MDAVKSGYNEYQYLIEGCSHPATHFDSLEKISKISYRMIDIAGILRGISTPFTLLSSQIKNLVLSIESTRFFVNAPSLLFPDEKGQYFLQTNTNVKCAERVSVVAHTSIKCVDGAHRLGLVRLGTIATKAFAGVPIFRWVLEGTILMFYAFGTWDAAREVTNIQNKMKLCAKHLNNIQQVDAPHPIEMNGDNDRNLKKWKIEKANLQIDLNKAWMKIAANVGKIILISLALTFAMVNLATMSTQLFILSLGTVTDLIGITRIFYTVYRPMLVC